MFDIEPEDMLNEFLHPKDRSFPMTKAEMDDKRTEDLMERLFEKEASLTDEERISPDTFGCDCIFLEHFANKEMRADFSLIARDFLLHEFGDIDNHEMIDYTDYDCGECTPDHIFILFIMNLMMNAVNAGSEYTKNLFCYLYKTYYKQEYKQLKRFNRVNAIDVSYLAESKDHSPEPEDLARVLTMAKLFGIEIDPDCSFFYVMLNNMNQEIRMESGPMEYGFDSGMYSDSLNALLEKHSEKELIDLYDKSADFADRCLSHFGYVENYTIKCNYEHQDILMDYAKAFTFLKDTYPKRDDFSKHELATALEVLIAVGALCDSVDDMTDRLREVTYGKRGTDYWDNFPERFKPEAVGGVIRQQKPKKPEVKAPVTLKPSDDKEKLLMDEITSLRRKIHEQESMIKQMKLDLKDKGKLQTDLQSSYAKNDTYQKELAALRDHLYHMTEDEEETAEISTDEMIQALADKKVIIIGGHIKWAAKIKEMFPKWVMIKADHTGLPDVSVVMGADKVYFFTDYLSHVAYNRYVGACRDNKVNFGYIHGRNIDTNLKQLYRELK